MRGCDSCFMKGKWGQALRCGACAKNVVAAAGEREEEGSGGRGGGLESGRVQTDQ